MMQIVNNRLPAATEGAGAPASPTARSGQALEGVRGLARRTARLTASTGLAGSLAIMGLMGSTAMPGSVARAQGIPAVDLCTGLSLNASVLRDRIAPFLQAVVNPLEATLNPVIGNVGAIAGALTAPLPVVGPILGSIPGLQPTSPLNLNVAGILGGVAAGDPIGLQVLGSNGQILGPGADCNILADSFQLDGTQGISIGGNQITGLGSGTGAPAIARTVDSIAFGDNAQTGVGSAGAIALGVNAGVGATAAGAIALGDTAAVAAGATGGVALGAGATVGGVGSLALGAGATVAQANSIALGAGSATTRGAQTGYAAIGLGAGQASTGELNVGGRTLTGLAPGTAVGDAVNVSQLTSVANALGSTATSLGGGAAYNPATGVFTPPSFAVQGAPRTTVGAALTALDGQVSTNTTNIANLTSGTVGLVQQLAVGAPITIGAAVAGDTIDVAGSAGVRTLTGVDAGALTAASTDAVTGAQLFATNELVDAVGTGLAGAVDAIGGGASLDPITGVLTAPAFVLGAVTGTGTTVFDNVGDALGNLDTRTLENTTDITNLTNNIENGTVGLVQQLVPGGPLTVGAGVGGTVVDFANATGDARVLTGIADGALSDTSVDAVTGAQLFATNELVDAVGTGLAGAVDAIGGGASLDPITGVLTAPAFVLGAVTGTGTEIFDNVGDALGNLDTRTLENTTDITNLTTNIENGTVGLVQQLVPGGPLTVGAGVGGTVVDLANIDGDARVLTGVGAGAVVAGSTDAVTGDQLFAINELVGTVQTGLTNTAALIGAGTAYDPVTGTFTPPTFSLEGGTVLETTVGGAISNLDTRTTNLAGQIGSGTIGLVQQLDPDGAITVAAATGGNLVSFAGTAGPRVLTGVADGTVAAGSTAVVTGNQLFATNTAVIGIGAGLGATAGALGGGASFDPITGDFNPPAFILAAASGVGTTTFDNVGDALANLDGRTLENTTDITNLTTNIENGTVGLVQQLVPGGPLTVGAGVGGTVVDLANIDGDARVLTGVGAGAVVAGSTDAVTGDQLFAINELVGTVQTGLTNTAALIGAGTAYDPVTGTFTPPTFSLEGGTVLETTVGGAISNLDTRTTNLAGQIGSGTIGLVQQLDPAGAITVAAATGGNLVNFAGTAGPRVLTGVGAGAVAAGSTDAVNGGQLFETNTGLAATAGALGGGASFDPATGTFTGPSYSLAGGTVTATNVGDAIGNLDGRTTANTTAIVDLSTQINTGQVGLVRQAAPGADLTVGATTDGDAVEFNQADGSTRLLTGLTDGSVAAGSTDAVTGNQAFATTTSIASALGGGASVAADGTLSAPTYSIGGTGFTDAGSAFAALDDSVTALQNQVGAFDPGGNLAFVSVNTTQGPARATGTETVAIGGGSVASGANSSAYGSGASAVGAGSSAFGAGASAGFDNSSAFGAGASATRANQMVFGTASNTYTMPGLTSDASRAAQSGPLDVVTTDGAGNLASLPLSDFFSGVTAIEGQLARMDRKFDRQSDGIAIAMALGAVALPADKTFALTGSVGYFDDTAAFGIGAVGQIADNWYLNGGIGVGTERGTVAGRAGLTYAW